MKDGAFSEQTLEVDGVRINYAEGGKNGPPLVLLHGGSSRWQWWRTVIDELEERFHVVAPDLRGHGRSSWTPGRYALTDYAGDVVALIERVIGRPAIVMGHSLGGEVALVAAAERPDLVLAVLDEEGPLSKDGARRAIAPSRPMLQAMRAVAGSTLPPDELVRRVGELPVGAEGERGAVSLREALGGDVSELEWAAESARHNDPAMLDAVIEFEDMHEALGEGICARISCPVVILQADPAFGGALTDEEVSETLALLHEGRHVRFDGCGHSIHVEDPERFLDAVLPILADLSA